MYVGNALINVVMLRSGREKSKFQMGTTFDNETCRDSTEKNNPKLV